MGRGAASAPTLAPPLSAAEEVVSQEIDKAFSRNWRQGFLLKGGDASSRRKVLDHCLNKLDPLEIAFACRSVDKRDKEDLFEQVRKMSLRVLEEICPRRNLLYCQEAINFFALDPTLSQEISEEAEGIFKEIFGHLPFSYEQEEKIEDTLTLIASLADMNSKRVIFVFDGANKLDNKALADIIKPFKRVTAANYNNLMLVLSGTENLHSRLFDVDQDSSMMFSVASFKD